MGADADLPVGFSGFSLCTGQACGRGQEGLRACSRKEATMLAAMAGSRPRAAGERPGAELLADLGSSCCWSGSESWKWGLAVPELCVVCKGCGGGEAVLLEGERYMECGKATQDPCPGL